MNKLPHAKRVLVTTLLCEGMSMRAAGRSANVSYNTVCSLLADAGKACEAFHDDTVRGVHSKRVQCDEIWAFCYAKQKNVTTAKAAPDMAGDLWTWIGMDADSKLIISYLVGGRDGGAAHAIMQDMTGRLANRVQLTTDGYKAYLNPVQFGNHSPAPVIRGTASQSPSLARGGQDHGFQTGRGLEAVEDAFGADVHYAMLVKLYGDVPGPAGRYSPAECTGAIKTRVEGRPAYKHISTSYVERQNLNLRMGMRRFTRLTNAFSKSAEAHYHMVALYVVFHNFVRDHKTLRCTPAEAAGLTKSAMTVTDIVSLIDARAEPPKPRGPYKKRATA